jgi:cytochrome c oxidase subunit 2
MGRKMIYLGVLFALLSAACGPVEQNSGPGNISAGRYASNGERIYFTATSANGPISYTGGPSGGMILAPARSAGVGGRGMMELACADCHGRDGRGGEHVVAMTAIDAPDIRWSTLTESEHGEQSTQGQGKEGEMDHPPYTEQTFKRAVTQGLDPAGNPLEPAMPRWNMSNQDLDDLIAFLKTLG